MVKELSELAMTIAEDKVLFAASVAAVAVVVGGIFFYYVSSKPKRKVFLNPDEWKKLQLVEKVNLSHNVIFFKFSLGSPDTVLGLPIGQHVSIQALDEDGKEFQRPYTPTSLDTDLGHVDLVVKIYPNGAMSKALAKLNVGDLLPFKGPKGRFKYEPNSVRAFGMIGGGTGITPMYQVARAILENPKDKTKIRLISANVAEDDILLKAELDALASNYPEQFKVFYVLNQPPENWTGGVGFVTADLIKEFLPPPAQDVKVLRCGPPPMNKAMAAHLDALGYTKEMQFQF